MRREQVEDPKSELARVGVWDRGGVRQHQSPASACGTGVERGSPGQFECVRQCYAAGSAGVVGADELLFACADACAQSCPEALVNDETNELISVLRDECSDACFPLE